MKIAQYKQWILCEIIEGGNDFTNDKGILWIGGYKERLFPFMPPMGCTKRYDSFKDKDWSIVGLYPTLKEQGNPIVGNVIELINKFGFNHELTLILKDNIADID